MSTAQKSHRELCETAHQAAGIMGQKDPSTRLWLNDGEVVDGRLVAKTVDRDAPRDGEGSNLVLHVRLEDVAEIDRGIASIVTELEEVKRERDALAKVMKRTVALLPPVAQRDLRDAYREALRESMGDG